MVFGAIFKKETQKPAENTASAPKSAPGVQKTAEKIPLDSPDFDSDFENSFDSPEKLLADEILEPPKIAPQAQALPQKAALKSAQQQAVQKIPAFVSLDKYKEIRLSLRDIKLASAEMRKTMENLRQNRDGGTALLNSTIGGLERMEENIDKVRTVLRT
ncbi:MAG: hypothetical protein ABIF85_05680 [Nanoarchaeota archaeon]|nr:hypothetical protein [Nanoarchaeota archaeon]MBU4301109.1 hypothetical protein [Nanoarchaeota archaeon]MBU4452429.1 hypothetical protein [Nanoarchaeota archaeon]MCG2724590.1 hypothetical protein [archaeon]